MKIKILNITIVNWRIGEIIPMYGYKYDSKTKNKAYLIKTFILKTAIMEKEWIISLNRGILDGP